MKDLRKFPRYRTSAPIQFLDRTEATGTMVNASREGALIIPEKKLKPLNAYLSFRVDLSDGESIKIVGKVVRHTKHKGKDAMGIAFLELSSEDLTNWLAFLGGIREDVEAIPVRTTDKKAPVNEHANFSIRFLSRAKLKKFFPKSLRNEFYFSTNRVMQHGQIANITLLHPDNGTLLHIMVVVDRYGDHPLQKGKKGVYCKFLDPDKSLKEKIQNFV